MSTLRRLAAILLPCPLLLAFYACGGDDSTTTPAGDAGHDATAEAAPAVDAPVSTDAPSSTDAPTSTDAPPPVDGAVDAARPDAPSDASLLDVAPFDSAGLVVDSANGFCNNLANDGPAAPETQIPAAPPTPTGGTIALGIWHLTKWEVYTGVGGATGPTGNTRKVAFEFWSATNYEKVTADNGGPDEHDSRTYSFKAPTEFDSVQYCPTADNLSSDYSVSQDGSTLMLIAGTEVLTFVHQ